MLAHSSAPPGGSLQLRPNVLSRIYHHFWCKLWLFVIFELGYFWNSLNPPSLTDGSLCLCILLFLPSGWWFGRFHWPFPPYCIRFIPSSHHFPLQTMQGIWVKFPSSVSGKRPVVLSLKPGSSIRSLNLQDPLPSSIRQKVSHTPHHPTPALVHKTHPARCHFNSTKVASCILPQSWKNPQIVITEVAHSSMIPGPLYVQGPNLSVVLPPSKWTYFHQKCQGRDWKNKNSLKRLWQS